MTSLGNVLDPDPAEGDLRRGPDLHVEVEVPTAALGDPGGYRARLPDRIPYAGERVERATSPGHEGELHLHLPEALPVGAVLRLRRQGGVCAGGIPGDLYAKIVIDDRATARRGRGALAQLVRTSPDTPLAVPILWVMGALTLFGALLAFLFV